MAGVISGKEVLFGVINLKLKMMAIESKSDAIQRVYESFVAIRLDKPKWNLGTKQRTALYKTVDFVLKNDLPIGPYIASQFLVLIEPLCLKLFKLKYPPLSFLYTRAALDRYEQWLRGQSKGMSVEESNKRSKQLYEEAGTRERRCVLVAGGLISPYFIATLDEVEAEELIVFASSSTEKLYRRIKNG